MTKDQFSYRCRFTILSDPGNSTYTLLGNERSGDPGFAVYREQYTGPSFLCSVLTFGEHGFSWYCYVLGERCSGYVDYAQMNLINN